MRLLKFLRLMLIAGTLAGSSAAITATSVLGYGHADGPLAQIEFSANCNNPDFPLCAAPPAGFGLGGIWLWIEIDGGAGATSGDADVAGAVCGHVRGVGGGAGSVKGEFEWRWSATPEGFPAVMGYPLDPNGYYNVDLGEFGVIAFPVSQGHYSNRPAPGVTLQLQIAP
jgi:hypothetical protein